MNRQTSYRDLSLPNLHADGQFTLIKFLQLADYRYA